MDEKKRISVRVLGREYMITAAEEEEYVQALAREVDKRLTETVNKSDNLLPLSAAILFLIEGMDTQNKTMATCENLRKQIRQYIEEASQARIESVTLKKQVEDLQRKNEALQNKLELASLRKSFENE